MYRLAICPNVSVIGGQAFDNVCITSDAHEDVSDDVDKDGVDEKARVL